MSRWHVALGFIDPAIDLGDGEVILSRHLSDRGLEDVHDHGRFALRGPSLDGIIVAHPVLLMAAL